MKKILFILIILIPSGLFGQNYWFTKPTTSSLGTSDLLLLYQSGTTKNFTIGTWCNVLNDTADVLRTELHNSWTAEIGDSTTVIRALIAAGATVDTGWTRSVNYTILKHIDDSVGVGTATPTEKFEVSGNVKGIRGIFDNGYQNLLLGPNSGESLTSSATYNVFAGYQVAKDATSPDYAVGIGGQTLYSLTTGAGNMGLCYRAGYSLTTGYSNLLQGVSAGYYLTDGHDNFYGGQEAGGGASSGASSSYGIRIGTYSGYNATGSYETLLSYLSGYASTASYIIGIGSESLYNLTENGGIGIGHQAGKAATSAANLTTGGFQSFTALTTGDDDSGWGYLLGSKITTGSKNSGLGSKAIGYTAVDIIGVTALGYSAGDSSTADYAIYIGPEAGGNNTQDSTLYIDITQTASPLIKGDFGADSVIINGDLTTTGILTGLSQVTLDTDATINLTAADCKGGYRINNDNDVIGYNLPSASAGLKITIYSIYGQTVTITPAAGDEIICQGEYSGAGAAVNNSGTGAVGDYITLLAIDNDYWISLDAIGTWVTP